MANGDFTVIEDGKPQAEIQLSNPSSPLQQRAADELKAALLKATGAELAVVPENTASSDKPRIVISSRAALPQEIQTQLVPRTENEEEVIIKSIGRALYITGPSDRAALLAVYTFLDRVADVRWLWPGPTGECIPRRASVAMKEMEIRETPGIKYRHLSINWPHYDDATQTWMARNRMNVDKVSGYFNAKPTYPLDYFAEAKRKGLSVCIGGHNIVLQRPVLEKNPDYIAMVNGKRQIHQGDHSHLCWSNQGVLEALVHDISAYLDQNPDVDIVSIFTADHSQYCQCSSCIAMAPDVSTRWQKFSRMLIEKVKAEHPKIDFWTLAYDSYRPVPKEEAAPFQNIGYAFYNGSYRAPWSSGAAKNRAPLSEIDGWLGKGAKMGIRGYETVIYNAPMALPLVYYVVDEINYAFRKGLVSYCTEVSPFGSPESRPAERQSWNTSRLNLYAMARAMWNPKITSEEVLADWCRHAYGPAAEAMQEYHKAFETAWRKAPGDPTDCLHPPFSAVDGFIDDGLISKAERCFNKGWDALASADGLSPDELARARGALLLDQRMFASWKMLFDLKRETPSRFVAPSLKASRTGGGVTWTEAASIALRSAKDGENAGGEVRTAWDAENLYIRFTCHEKGDATKAFGDEHEVLEGAHVEVIVNNINNRDAVRLAVSRNGGRFAEFLSASRKEPLPAWSATVAEGPNAGEWSAELKIALADLHIAPLPKPGGREPANNSLAASDISIAFGIYAAQGSAKPRIIAGWPEARAFPRNDFGILKRYNSAPPRVVIIDDGSSDILYASLKEEGWSVKRINPKGDAARDVLRERDVVVLAYGNGGNVPVSSHWMKETLLPFLENGGTLLVSSNTETPIDKWLGKPELAIKIDTSGFASVRRTARFEDGPWFRTPNDLVAIIGIRATPTTGLEPVGSAWKPLAEMTMRDGTIRPYFLHATVGKGKVIVTTTTLSYGGGFQLFGDRFASHVSLLIDNLRQWVATSVN